jgi:hypothetical protein
MNYNSQLQSNNTDLRQVLETLQHKAAGGGQPSGVCPSLTIEANSMAHYSSIFYSTNGQYILYFNSDPFPVILENIDIKRPIIINDPYGLADYLSVLNYTNLEILLDQADEMGIVCECTSTEAATLTLG